MIMRHNDYNNSGKPNEEFVQMRNSSALKPQKAMKDVSDPDIVKVWKLAGVLSFAIGMILAPFAWIALMNFIDLIRDPSLVDYMLGALSIGAAFLAGFFFFLGCGVRWRGLAQRYGLYQKELGQARFCAIKQLAITAGKSEHFVVKDLRRMLKRQCFPGAHIDEQQTCLILDSEAYSYSLAAQERSVRLEEEQELDREISEEESELNALMQESQEYIRQIKEANDAIPGKDITAKLSQLEAVTERIFACVLKKPGRVPDIRKFLRYYLPMTLKLVNAYKEFETQKLEGESIQAAKQEIQATLATINEAFEKLLNNLYEKDAMNISADISVLQAMLAQEGLTGQEFSKGDPSTKQRGRE